jgi:cyclic pyranopterin phosphate synthase
MVDVSSKQVTYREAVASGVVQMNRSTLKSIMEGAGVKGDVLATARLAGITGAKQTSHLIPLCHPLALESVTVEFRAVEPDELHVTARASITAKTGVEMEALTSVAAACLTVYDMCKSVDKGMKITQVQLQEKSGGRSGHYRRGSS